MKKFLLSLAFVSMGLTAFAAETSYTIVFKTGSDNNRPSFTSASLNTDVAAEGASFLTATPVAEVSATSPSLYGMKIGTNSGAGNITLNLSDAGKVLPTKVELVLSINKKYSESKPVTCTFNGKETPSITKQSSTTAQNYDTFTLTGFTEPLSTLKFEKTTTTKDAGSVFVKSITVYYEATGETKKTPEVSFPQDAYNVVFGSSFAAPTATTDSDGAVTYTSSDEAVATVDAETGVVTILAVGSTTITANVAATDTYFAGSAVYTLHVTDPNVILDSPMGEDFTFENVEGQSYPWSHDNKYGLKGSAYISNKVVACEGYAVSPVIDLNNKVDVTLNFQRMFNNYKVGGSIISVDDFSGYAYVVAREENATEWTVLSEIIPAALSWAFVDNDPISLDAYKGKKMQFAYKYVSTAECAGTWEVKNIKVSGKTSDGVENIEIVSDATPVYYNLQGQRVANPERGIYIRVQGNKSSKVMF